MDPGKGRNTVPTVELTSLKPVNGVSNCEVDQIEASLRRSSTFRWHWTVLRPSRYLLVIVKEPEAGVEIGLSLPLRLITHSGILAIGGWQGGDAGP